MRKKCMLLVMVIFMQLLSGCWDRVEINDIAIVSAVGLDKSEDGKILVTLLILVPKNIGYSGTSGGSSGSSGSVGEKESTLLVSEKGEGIMDAYRRIQEKLSRQIFLSHEGVIIIGEKLASDGVSDILDFFTRYRESKLGTYIVFTKRQAADFFKIGGGLEDIRTHNIEEQEKLGISVKTTLRDFVNMITEEGVNPIAAQLVKVPLESDNETNIENAESQSKKMTVAINGSAIFNKDKLIGWMSIEESRGALWLRNEIKTGAITVDIPEEKGGGKIGTRIKSAKTKINPVINGDELEMEVKIDTEAIIFENASKLDLSDPEEIYYIEKKIDEDIKKRIELTLEKAQKQLKAYVFGFGTSLYRKYPKK